MNLDFLSHVLRFLFPWVCCVCRKPLPYIEDRGFCSDCWVRLPRLQGPVCRFCGISLPEGGGRCFDCRDGRPEALLRAAGLYEEGLRAAVLRFKFSGRQTLAGPLAVLMAWAWRQYPELHAAQVLVPVPIHPKRLRERGFDQTKQLAESLGHLIGRPVEPLLERLLWKKPQTDFNRAERQTNVVGAFRARLKTDCDVLLIDDVCTTSATLWECAKVLRRAGARRVSALVVAKDQVKRSVDVK